jgi:hypothetical protein
MVIKTNLTRVTKIHDNVNFEPIARQVLTFIQSTGIFNKVEYKVSKDDQMFILNDRGRLHLDYNLYHLSLIYNGDSELQFVADSDSSFFGLKQNVIYNAENIDVTKYLKMVAQIMQANIEANKIISKFSFDEDTQAKLNLELNKYFKNPSVRVSYALFPVNLIPKLSNPYTPGVWSWLSFSLVGTKQEHSKHEKHVSLELYNDGSIKRPRIDEFIKAVQCNEHDMECKPTIKQMQARLNNIAKLEEKLKKFNGREIPVLKDFLALQDEGLEFRRNFKLIQ